MGGRSQNSRATSAGWSSAGRSSGEPENRIAGFPGRGESVTVEKGILFCIVVAVRLQFGRQPPIDHSRRLRCSTGDRRSAGGLSSRHWAVAAFVAMDIHVDLIALQFLDACRRRGGCLLQPVEGQPPRRSGQQMSVHIRTGEMTVEHGERSQDSDQNTRAGRQGTDGPEPEVR